MDGWTTWKHLVAEAQEEKLISTTFQFSEMWEIGCLYDHCETKKANTPNVTVYFKLYPNPLKITLLKIIKFIFYVVRSVIIVRIQHSQANLLFTPSITFSLIITLWSLWAFKRLYQSWDNPIILHTHTYIKLYQCEIVWEENMAEIAFWREIHSTCSMCLLLIETDIISSLYGQPD